MYIKFCRIHDADIKLSDEAKTKCFDEVTNLSVELKEKPGMAVLCRCCGL